MKPLFKKTAIAAATELAEAGLPGPSNVVECLDPLTDEQLIDRALGMSTRQIADVPTSIIPADHPARTAGRLGNDLSRNARRQYGKSGRHFASEAAGKAHLNGCFEQEPLSLVGRGCVKTR